MALQGHDFLTLELELEPYREEINSWLIVELSNYGNITFKIEG